eukprot:3301170-Pyramimonas_sp.AAC.2
MDKAEHSGSTHMHTGDTRRRGGQGGQAGAHGRVALAHALDASHLSEAVSVVDRRDTCEVNAFMHGGVTNADFIITWPNLFTGRDVTASDQKQLSCMIVVIVPRGVT